MFSLIVQSVKSFTWSKGKAIKTMVSLFVENIKIYSIKSPNILIFSQLKLIKFHIELMLF
jgi:hypothetical protein